MFGLYAAPQRSSTATTETNLTYAKAMELAQGMEAADRKLRSFKGTELAMKKIGNKPPSHRALDVGKQGMQLPNAVSKMQNATLAAKRAISPQLAGPLSSVRTLQDERR